MHKSLCFAPKSAAARLVLAVTAGARTEPLPDHSIHHPECLGKPLAALLREMGILDPPGWDPASSRVGCCILQEGICILWEFGMLHPQNPPGGTRVSRSQQSSRSMAGGNAAPSAPELGAASSSRAGRADSGDRAVPGPGAQHPPPAGLHSSCGLGPSPVTSPGAAAAPRAGHSRPAPRCARWSVPNVALAPPGSCREQPWPRSSSAGPDPTPPVPSSRQLHCQPRPVLGICCSTNICCTSARAALTLPLILADFG